jgi:hypothetical protein
LVGIGVSKAERRLVSSLLKGLARRSLHSPGERFCLELDCFQGVADVVIATPNDDMFLPATVTTRMLKRFSLSTAKVLAALRGQKLTHLSQVEEATGLSQKTIRKQLRLLERFQILTAEGEGQIRVGRAIRPPFREIAAFEAKVKDWKSGLRQARSYRSFAHRVSLALPLGRAESMRKEIQVFRRFNVGLVGVGRQGEIKWINRSRRTKPISPARNLLASVYLLKGRPLSLLNSNSTSQRAERTSPTS